MYSLSVLAKLKGWEFDYYVDHVPKYLRENPQGNYRRALENGMQIREDSIDMNSLGDEVLAIQEGGRDREAELGVKILADEIATWQKDQGIKKLNIFLPSGTGATALYLQKNSHNKVYTTPCVGDDSYLKKQFTMLVEDEKYHPTILNTQKRYHFGKLYRDFYKIWLKLQQETKVEFDLLYDPKGWMVVMDNLDIFSQPTLYIHQGGLVGNESMLPRYERKYKKQIQ
jgi:1-aminocyclopropane-1-carboxylate deaminase/D-cysteine desulfhydrase-like pyridoxal-dependent ACC family enzyme